MPPTKRAEAEAVVPGLANCLAIWRYEGDTFTEIAWRLRTDYGITVSAETVRQWCADDGPAAA